MLAPQSPRMPSSAMRLLRSIWRPTVGSTSAMSTMWANSQMLSSVSFVRSALEVSTCVPGPVAVTPATLTVTPSRESSVTLV